MTKSFFVKSYYICLIDKMSNSCREILGNGCSPKVALFARCVACDIILVMHNLRRGFVVLHVKEGR